MIKISHISNQNTIHFLKFFDRRASQLVLLPWTSSIT